LIRFVTDFYTSSLLVVQMEQAMQDLLSGLRPAVVGALIITVILIVAVLIVLFQRLRRHRPAADEAATAGLAEPVDYTALPIEEKPRSWRERFRQLSVAGRFLVILLPIVAVLALLILILFMRPSAGPVAFTPTGIPIRLVLRDAAVIRADPLTISIRVESSGLADGTPLSVEMFEDGQPFAWLNAAEAVGSIQDNRAEIQIQQASDASLPTEGRRYTLLVRGPNGAVSGEVVLSTPEVGGIADRFYGRSVAEVATATAPTLATATPLPAPTATPVPMATATPTLPSGPAAVVTNGGNVRRQPLIIATNVIGGINAGEQVQLLARTPNGLWYSVRTVRDEIGWVSVTLIRLPDGVEVAVASVVTVFVDGVVFAQPDKSSAERDRVVRNEVVELLQRTAAGDWYEVLTVRDQQGWVAAELLGIPPDVATAVPTRP
jgi:hypothetical protein